MKLSDLYFKSIFLVTFEKRPTRDKYGDWVASWETVTIIQVREDDDLFQGGSSGSGEKRLNYVYIF